MIYFLRAGDSDHVKIGWSKDADALRRRIATLQTGQPLPLVVLRTLDADRWCEGWLHRTCWHLLHRLRAMLAAGETFPLVDLFA